MSAIGDERGNESVEEEDCRVWNLIEDRECVGYGNGGGEEEESAERVSVEGETGWEHMGMDLLNGVQGLAFFQELEGWVLEVWVLGHHFMAYLDAVI